MLTGKATTEDWHEVPIRKRGSQDSERDQTKQDKGIKFFVSNIPDKCSVEDLKTFFGEYGKIAKVYVARKLDKFGQRFAFVTFLDDRNVQDLGDNMKNVKMGDKKLFISFAKFVDGNFVGNRKQPGETVRAAGRSVRESWI